MKIIKCLSEDIECELDIAEDYAKKAIEYQIDYPEQSKLYYSKSLTRDI